MKLIDKAVKQYFKSEKYPESGNTDRVVDLVILSKLDRFFIRNESSMRATLDTANMSHKAVLKLLQGDPEILKYIGDNHNLQHLARRIYNSDDMYNHWNDLYNEIGQELQQTFLDEVQDRLVNMKKPAKASRLASIANRIKKQSSPRYRIFSGADRYDTDAYGDTLKANPSWDWSGKNVHKKLKDLPEVYTNHSSSLEGALKKMKSFGPFLQVFKVMGKNGVEIVAIYDVEDVSLPKGPSYTARDYLLLVDTASNKGFNDADVKLATRKLM